jgi:hypothetical protein
MLTEPLVVPIDSSSEWKSNVNMDLVRGLDNVSLDSFIKESDDLYISIDNFLNPQKKLESQKAYDEYLGKYAFYIIVNQEYKSALRDRILPDFQQFVQEDAACETACLYASTIIEKFVDFLRGRLSYLHLLYNINVN